MADAVAKVKAEIVRYESNIKKQTDLRNKNKIEILNEEKKMGNTVEKLIRDLREHERKMKDKFREIYEAEQKHHATRLENFELVVTQLKSCFERCQGILERNFRVEILQTNHAILGRCNELLNVRKPDLYMSPHIHYLLDKKLDLMDKVVVTKTDDKIKVDILTPEGERLKTDIKDTKDGKYTVIYKPQCAGQHRVEILVNGQPLTGSPWIVQVGEHQYQFAFQFGSGEGKFRREMRLDSRPSSKAFTDSGDLLSLVRENDNKLRLFSEEGHFIKHINGKHLDKPGRLSIASDGLIIITGCGDNKIKVLSPDGNDLLQSFSAPDCDESPSCPICNQDRFFVSYLLANCVKVFDKRGVYLHDIGCEGSSDGQLDGPCGPVIDKYNRLIVCDAGNQRLQLFTLRGKFLSKIDGQHLEDGCPSFVAINSGGSLIVANSYNGFISVCH
ncbi:E3 ubiquitin-protein ligase TRIM71-like [Montipora foliosa]|uniref:E3 ubiquitin-protein ligase TRIM71-like n=1 Tax=Montipora foliosa TaxID=591990 RepID=UPI0035F2004D